MPVMTDGPHVFTALRIRPPLKWESQASVVHPQENGAVAVSSAGGTRMFDVDACFTSADASLPSYTDQAGVYDEIGRGVVQRALMAQGNTTVISYGSNASGKSYTLLGPPSSSASAAVAPTAMQSNALGLVPRMCYGILGAIDGNPNLNLAISMLEVGVERVRDLAPARSARASEVRLKQKGHVFYADGLSRHVVRTMADVRQALHTGMGRRVSHERCHVIFRLSLVQNDKTDGLVERLSSWLTNSAPSYADKAVINLVDLVGSDKPRTGDFDRSAVPQSRSLQHLGSIIAQLSTEGSTMRQSIAYRGSKITSLLQESMSPELGGKIVLLAHTSPSITQVEETLATMQYVTRGRPKDDAATAKRRSQPLSSRASPDKLPRQNANAVAHAHDKSTTRASASQSKRGGPVAPKAAASKSVSSLPPSKELEALKQRLVQFYTAVGAPEKLPNVGTIGARYLGREKELSEKLRSLYGVDLDVVDKPTAPEKPSKQSSPETPLTPFDGEISDIQYISERHFALPREDSSLAHVSRPGAFWGSSHGWDEGVDKLRANESETELVTFAPHAVEDAPAAEVEAAALVVQPRPDSRQDQDKTQGDQEPEPGESESSELVLCQVKNDPYTKLSILCGFGASEQASDEEVEWFMDLSSASWSTGVDEDADDDDTNASLNASFSEPAAPLGEAPMLRAIQEHIVTQQLADAKAELDALESDTHDTDDDAWSTAAASTREKVAELTAKAAKLEQTNGPGGLWDRTAPLWDRMHSTGHLKQLLQCTLQLLAAEVDIENVEQRVKASERRVCPTALDLSALADLLADQQQDAATAKTSGNAKNADEELSARTVRSPLNDLNKAVATSQ